MSIPPLVCSTPPPPDQCDDKDTEEFDLQYNLSQDEDDGSNDYDYGHFPTFNYKSNSDIKLELPKFNDLDVQEESNEGCCDLNTNIVTKFGEEILEDLDLKLEQVSINSGVLNTSELDDQNDSSVEDPLSEEVVHNHGDIIEHVSNDVKEDISLPAVTDLAITKSENCIDLKYSNVTPIIENINNDEFISPTEIIGSGDNEPHATTKLNELESEINLEVPIENTDTQSVSNTIELNVLNNDEDEFGDFKLADSANTTSNVVSFDNPWGGQESNIKFTANFGDFENNTKVKDFDSCKQQSDEPSNDSDFEDDFDDFKSSAVDSSVNTQTSQIETNTKEQTEISVNVTKKTNDHLQNADEIIKSIFEVDDSETETKQEAKLESSLCETWGRLMDVETRQPYIIYWNNSLGQKTLLKALCIDSRNILFGPKWTSNMPKYATNLSLAPLQPQKQSSSIPNPPEAVNQEKTIKPADTWTDPFTSDGKESRGNENGKTVPPISSTASSTDISVLETEAKVNSDVFSSTINIQPIRQINLPDTHIFTPTDSEIPRSKTIHYDSPVLIPQTSTTIADDFDYFQDFRGAADVSKQTVLPAVENVKNKTVATDIPTQIGMLKPIKIEPIVPTLNWPDPGEIKETFDDFTDFVSSTSWHNDQETKSNQVNTLEPQILNKNLSSQASTSIEPNSFNDDDFETFQSAAPPVPINTKLIPEDTLYFNELEKTTSNSSSVLPTTSQQDFDVDFSNFSSYVNTSSNIKVPAHTNEDIQTHIPYVNCKAELSHSSKSSPTHFTNEPNLMQILQPIQATSISNKPSGQILQPLSLEGYSQINWPNPGSLDLQDLSRFNPVETLPSFKNESSNHSKNASPAHSQRSKASDDDIWGDFVSSKPAPSSMKPVPQATLIDEDEWTDFVSSTSVPQNGLNTISLNVHTNFSMQKSPKASRYVKQVDIPALNYVTPNSSKHRAYSDRHFQNL